jgi:CRP/FNR family transcriptional activator FtrB
MTVADGGLSIQYVAKDQILFEEGSPADRLYEVVGGQVALVSRDSGKVVDLLGPGAVFGEEALCGGGRMFSAKVVCRGRVAMLDPGKVHAADGSLAGLTRFVLVRVVERQSRLVREISSLKSMPPLQRLARLILGLPDFTPDRASIKLPWPKRVIAERLGIRPETFSRLLPGLADHGARISGCWVEIADFRRFESFAKGEPRQWRLRKPAVRGANVP